MFSIRVLHDLDDLERDLKAAPHKAMRDMRDLVRDATRAGHSLARDYAKVSAGRHGKHYHRAITWETSSFLGFGGGTFVGVYGPDSGRRQGGMSFEGGSRNQPAHNDLAKSLDRVRPTFYGEARRLPERWF